MAFNFENVGIMQIASPLTDNFDLNLNFLALDAANLLPIDAGVGNGSENFTAIYHYSVPTVKLAYPEPFLASASLMHGDLWFIHILVYQYWLWFVFVFIIVFFFITFIWTVRWCNMRTRPRLETRGVSRSKCGDLITACVPVSWATSIIVNESTDAIDYFDGFGTSELVIGIRAYQWGWEYYYPKDLDLNYSLRNNFASMIGNSLKYESTTNRALKSAQMWKLYQGKFSDAILNPISTLLRADVFHILNLLNFGETGLLAMSESAAFRKVQTASKITNLITDAANVELNVINYKLWDDYTETETAIFNAIGYGLRRQTSVMSKNFIHQTLFDNRKIEQFLTAVTPHLLPTVSNSISPNPSFGELGTDCNSSPFSLLPSFFNLVGFVANNRHSKRPLLEIFFLPLLNSDSFFKSPVQFFSSSTSDSAVLFKTENSSLPLIERTIRNMVQLSMKADNSDEILNSDTTSDFRAVRESSLNPSVAENFSSYRGEGDLFSRKGVKLWMGNFYFDATISPIVTNLSTASLSNFDASSHNANTMKTTLPVFVQSKEEAISPALLSAYWNSSLADSDQRWRFLNFKQLQDRENFQLTPSFDLFYDYDFRNWQSLELLEDAIWEDVNSTLYFDEYRENMLVPQNTIKEGELVRLFTQTEQGGQTETQTTLPLRVKRASVSELSSTVTTDINKSFSIQNLEMREIFCKTPLSLNDVYLRSNLRSFDDTMELASLSRLMLRTDNHAIKQIGGIYATILSTPVSVILNSFRSDFDEASVISSYRLMTLRNSWTNISPEFWQQITKMNLALATIDANKSIQMPETIDQRSSAKSLIVSSNAITKIFKNRYDDFRSLARLRDFSDMEAKQFLISNDRINYETLLKKNNPSFFSLDFFKTKRNRIEIGGVRDLVTQNTSIFDFPFVTALKSEAARYIWLDWFSKWNYVDIQPSSSARYAIFGMPYFNKAFDFNTNENEIVNDTETYFMRIARARKNYLPLWTFSPFMFLKGNQWASNSQMSVGGNLDQIQLTLINVGDAFSTYTRILPDANLPSSPLPFNPTFSAIALYTKSFALSNEMVNLYYFFLSMLSDTLTKRELAIRALTPDVWVGEASSRILLNHPQNPLLNSFSNLFLYRDTLNQKQNLSDWSWGRGKIYSKLVRNGFTGVEHNSANSFENLLLKNQYRPLRKGVNNMLRLHATGAIAMPTEMRMQILASSKDVIHSWAIPSAGIKIDCVPGYSSHRIMIFLVSGIFWGPCMEVCGRYHHWMPIVVYFMKKDLFFLWCSHFVFFNPSTSTFGVNARQHESNLGLVTHDKFSWLTEMR